MGCEQSKESDVEGAKPKMGSRKGIGHTERMGSQTRLARKGVGHTERMPRNRVSESITASLPPQLDKDGHMTEESVQRRIAKSVKVNQIVLGGEEDGKSAEERTRLDYAYVSQRGYYPDDVHKANQDKYSITTNFAGVEGDVLFAVYDGHGHYGHDCAEFAKGRYPKILAKHVRQLRIKQHKENMAAKAKSDNGDVKKSQKGAFNPKLWPMLTTTQYKAAIRKAHTECNKAMHNANAVDDTLSGTTLVACVFHDGNMIVSNAGDSRAVLGYNIEKKVDRPVSEEEKEDVEEEIGRAAKDEELDKAYDELAANLGDGGKLVALPLTRDHTPFRTDERERVKKAGGRVLTVDMLEGIVPVHENFGEFKMGEDIDEVGDPPRVWVKDADFPGTAFTRSLGDTVAESIGVTATPEIISRVVTKNDRMLVVASDGVFEFLPNQTVIDICQDCTDPLTACQKLVEESYKKWLHYELRTDDITAIVIFIQCQNECSDEPSDIRELIGISTAQGQKPMKSAASPPPQSKPEPAGSLQQPGGPLSSLKEELVETEATNVDTEISGGDTAEDALNGHDTEANGEAVEVRA